MEQENIMNSMLDLIERPAFCVCNGTVVQANIGARQRMVTVGSNISDLLKDNISAYEAFKEGTLTLNTHIAGVCYRTQVSRMGNADIFLLEQEDPQMQAIALAAQYLRTPLNNVMTVAEFISGNDDKYMGQLQKGLHRLHRIVCNMSDSYRYQQEGTANMAATDIPRVFAESMEAIGTLLERCNIRLVYTGLEESLFGLADREMLERAVYNMVSNAVKFMTNGGTLFAKLTQSGTQLSFTLQTETEISGSVDFFNRYQRQPGVEDDRNGIGLGMPLVRAVASAHGGTVLIDHPEAQVTRITMTISITEPTDNVVRSSVYLPISNYAGERDRGLLELSEILPAEIYQDMV